MRRVNLNRFLPLLVLLAASHGTVGRAESLQFTALTISGQQFSAAESNEQLTVVCFLGVQCPMARIYGPHLEAMSQEFRDRGVQFVGVNSNRQDSFAEVKKFAQEHQITFPFVRDKDNVIADQFQATRTPEVFLLNAKLGVMYHGRIDDQYEPGINRNAAKRRDLRIAIEEMLAGKPVSRAKTTATGCLIGKVNAGDRELVVQNNVTYHKHVVPVLQQHCLECHRASEIGPFAMDSYGEVAGWADTMLETIDNGRMPPWHANPQHGDFLNSRTMPDADKQILRDWVAGGVKEGDSADAPEPARYTDGWRLDGEPDQIVAMRKRPFVVPADGVVEYQYFVVDPGFTEDKWISGAQVIPGSRAVVHHAIVFVRPPDGEGIPGVGWLGAYVPGQQLVALQPGRARKVPAGSRFVFQMHYTPNGRPQEDTTKVGLKFANDQDVTHEVFTLIALNQEFEIPPHADRHLVQAKVPWLPPQAELLAATPHMHYRGKSFRLFGSDDDSSVLLDVPSYDFNWQHTYALKEPIPLDNLQQLRFDVAFDNSTDNPFNPDPKQWVTWGDQTWEEMAVAFFEVSQPRTLAKKKQTTDTQRSAADETERELKIAAYVKRAMAAMDTNADGKITKGEAPIVVRHFRGFGNLDVDADGTVTGEELRTVASDLY